MIAIPNMEKPQNCAECPISVLSDFSGIVCKLNRNNDKSNCPLIDIVTCKECIHKMQALSTEKGATGCELISGTFYEDFFCKEGKRKADYTVFTVNPPKGIETPLKGDATVFHQNSKMGENVARPTATSSTEVPWWLGE